MSIYLNEKYRKLDPYIPGEQPQDKKYIKLNTNESPFPPAPGVIEALANESGGEKLRLYPDPSASVLKKELASSLGVDDDMVFLSGGSDEVLDYCFTAFCENGVIFPDITYGFYEVFANLRKVEFKKIPLLDDFSINANDYIKEKKTKVFANPNAPTGLYLPLSKIEKIASSDREHLTIVDEAYIDFGCESAISLTADNPNLLVVGTFSKSRSLAGARVGYAVGNPDIILDLEKIKFSCNPYNISALSLTAATEAVKDKAYFDKCRNEIIRVREWVKTELSKRGYNCTDSKSNFLFVVHPDYDGKTLYLELKNRGVLVRRFDIPKIENHLRITIGTKDDMKFFLKTLDEITEEIKR